MRGARITRTSAVALLLAGLLPACADDRSRIFVYAQRDTPARSWIPVLAGGAKVAELKRGYLFAMDVEAGRYSLGIESGVPLSVELLAGQNVFVRLDWRHTVGQAPVPAFSKVPTEIAEKEIRFLSYIPVEKVRSASVLKADPRTQASPQFKTRH